jgi:hypothetical protein
MIAEYFRHTVRRKHETIEQFKKARVVFSKAWTFITLNIHILCGSQSAKSLQTDRIILFLTHFESSFIRRKFLFLSLSLFQYVTPVTFANLLVELFSELQLATLCM